MGRDIAVQVGDGRVGSGKEGEGFNAWRGDGKEVLARGMEIEGENIVFDKGKVYFLFKCVKLIAEFHQEGLSTQ